MRRRGLLVDLSAALTALLVASSALAQVDTFAKANQEYAAGQFKEAIADYETLVQKKEWSANLFYDLGNAYFRAQDFGKAILNYERALALDRHHAEAQANLRVARDQARALRLQQSQVERYVRAGSPNQYAIAAAAMFWIGIFIGASLLFGQRRSTSAITLSILSLSIFIALGVAIYAMENGSGGRGVAIVTKANVTARVATADTSSSVLAVPAGSEIKVLSERGEWVYAALPNNLRGWIPANNAEPVRL
ncbi:MAG: tetratricopeptide repeat protein [Spartobacteria bacterium]